MLKEYYLWYIAISVSEIPIIIRDMIKDTKSFKGVLYSMMAPDLLGMAVDV